MTFSEYMQLRERAEAAGIGDDKSLAQLLHYLQFQEVATRNFQAYMNEMGAWCRNIVKEVESRIKDAEVVGMSDMHTCDLCGKPTSNFTPWTCGPIAGKLGRSWCDDCEEQFKRELALEDEQLRYDDIDRDELLRIADECEEADVDGVSDWAARIRKAVGE